jgi:hypothetical protein
MKRWCGILIVVLLLFVLGSRNWFAPRQAKPMADVPKKTEYQQQIASLPKQKTASSSAVVHENASSNEQISQASSPEAFRVTLLSSVPGRTRFRFELGDFTVQEETINGKTYSRVQLDGAWPLASKGRPALPVIRRDFAIAKGRQASMWIKDVQEERIACAPPKPSVGELPRTAEIPPVEEDASVYGGDGVYPPVAVATGERYVIRGAEGMSVDIRPMRYDFHDGVMVVTRSFEAEITEDGAAEDDYVMRDDEWNFRCLLKRRFENSNLLRSGGSNGIIGTMLFIAPDTWMERLADFVAWKEQLGYDVIVAGYPSVTGEGETSLASYIRNAYNDSAVSHVVLFGDRGNIPPYAISPYPNVPSTFSPTTDIPYSWVDGDDVYADLFISRMAVSTGAELSAVCAKIMAYERSGDDGGWHGRGVFIGSDQTGSSGVSDGRTDSSLIDEEYQKLLEDNGIEIGETLYVTERAVTANGIGTALNNGCSLVYYLGHGTSIQWTTGKYKNSNASDLANGGRLPFVASLCCDTANFAYKSTCLGEAFLRNADGGAVGFLGATSETYWNPPIYAMRQMTDDILKRHSDSRLTCQGAYACSAIMAGIDYLKTADPMEGSGTSQYFAKQMHLLGDSSALGRLGSGRKCVVALSRHAATAQYGVSVTWEDTGEPVAGAAVCIRTADGASRYAVRSGNDGTAMLPSFSSRTIVMVSDGSWGCVEQDIDIGWVMDTDMDGAVSNAEAITYLNSLDRTATTADELAAVAEAWARGGDLSIASRMTATRGAAVATVVSRRRARDDAALREPGGPEPKVNTRTATPMTYWTIDGLNKRLDEWCLQYPEYCQEAYVGRSLEGRDIMALRLSCFEGDGNCPEFMIAAGIHGNERISTWMAMRLVESILADLDNAESVYRPMLSRCALWIIPAMNPDGASATRPQRYNAKNHDMNRSFPDGALQPLGTFANGDGMMTGGYVPTVDVVHGVNRFPASEVPETTAFMRFCMEHPCKAALHLHSGDVLISYPYGNNAERKDGYTASPDDELYRALADAYQDGYDGEIDHKNSCEWYQVDGEAPDWQYRYTGTLALTIELSLCKEPAWLENCENAWKKHEGSFSTWLGDALVVVSAKNKTRSITLNEGVKVMANADFKRLMPWEDGKLSIVAKGVAMGVSGGACVMNVACESGMAASTMGNPPDGVIGERTESDGSVSWLIYSLKTEVDESLNIGLRSTDDVNDNDHIVSLVALTSKGEHLMFRRQILLAEKRSFSWQLKRGWNFISSPLRGEELTVGIPCLVMYWNGMRYTDTTHLQVSDFQPCNAFWVYSSIKQTLSLDGRMGLSGPTLRKGWNTIGGLYCKALDESVFTTDGNYNVITNIMQPGLGYWIFVK